MDILNRRRFLAAALGLPVAAAVGSAVTAAPGSTHSLWRLDPSWGYPLTTDSGSDTKSSCRASACHKAAVHRYFLSEADAVAGRLHPCCLAQPVRVDVCVDLNELMPYYTARLGGIDARCPTLPTDVRNALQAAGACIVPTTTEPTTTEPTTTEPTTTEPTTTEPTRTDVDSASSGAGGTSTTSTTSATSSATPTTPPGSTNLPTSVDQLAGAAGAGSLPATGSSAATVIGVASVLAAAGSIALITTRAEHPSTDAA